MPKKFILATIPSLSRSSVDSHPLSITRTAVDVKRPSLPPSVGGGSVKGKNASQGKEHSNKGKVKTTWDGIDPLSAALHAAKIDEDEESFKPEETVSSSSSTTQRGGSSRGSVAPTDETNKIWTPLRSEIIVGFTTTDKLSLKSSFLPHSSKTVSVGASAAPATVSLTEKVKNRLEQLDEMDEATVSEERNLSPKEYIARIENLQQIVITSWDGEQRVKALKIAIQCAKLLTDVSSCSFYPTKFILVADLLDKFGSLVFDRINEKMRLTSDEAALDTCTNWFYKIASIREMIPRFYVEAAIMRVYSFINIEGEPTSSDTLNRLSSMVRGVSDPIIAAYCRMFLCRVALKIAPQDKIFFIHQVREVFVILNTQMETKVVKDVLDKQALSLMQYCKILSPSLTWISKCLAYEASDESTRESYSTLSRIITRCHIAELNLVILTASVSSFKGTFVVKNFDSIFELLDTYCSVPGEEASLSPLLVSLGKAFVSIGSSNLDLNRDEKVNILRIVWSKVTTLPVIKYLACAEVWIEFVATHLLTKEVNSFLKDTLKHLEGKEPSLEQDNKIAKVLSSVFCQSRDHILELMAMDTVIPLVESINDDGVRLAIAKEIVSNFLKTCSEFDIGVDFIEVLNNLGFLCQVIHDSVTAVSLEDEKRDIAILITGYLRLVVFSPGIDIETRLKLLQEARSSFFNIDSVLSFLVHAVNSLPFMAGKSRLPMDFIKTCLAYAFITVPAITDPVLKLQLYLSSCQVALVNACLSQLDSFVKAAINLLSHLPKSHVSSDGHPISYDSFFCSYTCELLSVLLFVPDHPDHEPLYLTKGLMSVIETRDFDSPDTRIRLCLELLTLLSWVAQEKYPLHFKGGKYKNPA